jgi:hypothetical protein
LSSVIAGIPTRLYIPVASALGNIMNSECRVRHQVNTNGSIAKMTEARLKTEIWVQACVRRGNADGIAVTVIHKGDPARGSVIVKLNRFAQGCIVLAETRDEEGGRAWIRGTGPEPVAEQAADEYVTRNRRYDPDLWVIEVEDRDGRLPFDGKILAI